MEPKVIGIIGCGAIGSHLAKYAQEELSSFVSKVVIYDADRSASEKIASKLEKVTTADSIEEVVDKVDIVVESAVAQVVPKVLSAAISKRKDVMIMSIGGLLGNEDLLKKASEKGIEVILPSGAVSGIDGLRSAKIAGIESVTLTTRKAPRSIKGAPYLSENNIDVDAITGETIVFEGNAIGAMKGFPKNINVSALLSIAGIGAEKTLVKIIVSPEYTKNIHEVEIKSKAGLISTRTENIPSPDNPKTSYLAALAAITSLKGYFDTVRVGT